MIVCVEAPGILRVSKVGLQWNRQTFFWAPSPAFPHTSGFFSGGSWGVLEFGMNWLNFVCFFFVWVSKHRTVYWTLKRIQLLFFYLLFFLYLVTPQGRLSKRWRSRNMTSNRSKPFGRLEEKRCPPDATNLQGRGSKKFRNKKSVKRKWQAVKTNFLGTFLNIYSGNNKLYDRWAFRLFNILFKGSASMEWKYFDGIIITWIFVKVLIF